MNVLGDLSEILITHLYLFIKDFFKIGLKYFICIRMSLDTTNLFPRTNTIASLEAFLVSIIYKVNLTEKKMIGEK